MTMSAIAKITDKRLCITARYEHETVEYGGNIFEFIEQLIRDRRTGMGTFVLNQGDANKLTFDCRQKVSVDEQIK